jgi:hypothetical protein
MITIKDHFEDPLGDKKNGYFFGGISSKILCQEGRLCT